RGAPAATRRKDYQCALIYAEYQRRLVRHHLYDLEGRQWYARDLLARGARRPFAQVRAVFVDGFTDFTHTQHEILAALAAFVLELWVTLPDEAGGQRAELFSRPRQTLARLQALGPRVRHLERRAAAPAGLAHVERELFRPVKEVNQAAETA